MNPRVPGTWRGRLVLGAVLAFAPLLRADPGSPGPIEAVARGEGCVLASSGTGTPCPCEALPPRIRWALGLPLRLNRLDAAALVLLPGIGPVRARAIEEDRARRGGFAAVDDLARVHGIGPRAVEQLLPYLFVEGEDPACVRRGG